MQRFIYVADGCGRSPRAVFSSNQDASRSAAIHLSWHRSRPALSGLPVRLTSVSHRLDPGERHDDARLSIGTLAETAWWAGADLADHDWRPGPVVQDGAQFLAAVRLGQAVAFLPETMLEEAPLAGIAVVPAVDNVCGSELHLAWAQDATSPEIARFVRCAFPER